MTNNEKNAYEKLVKLSKRAAVFGSISHILGWDQETYMPKDAIGIRSMQFQALANHTHNIVTSEEYRKTLDALIDIESGELHANNLTSSQQACLRQWRRDYLHAAKLPEEFVEEFAKTTSTAIHVWQEAKRENDFKKLQPHLEKIVDLNLRKAQILGYEEHPYDALIDSFEPYMRTSTLTSLFKRLKTPLTQLLRAIGEKPMPDASCINQDFPRDQQLAFAEQLLRDMGFSEKSSRLDESAHPMCIPVHPQDMRMTTRIYPDDVTVNILSVAHEGGHGLYNSQLPVEHFGTPLCEAASLAMDESQSRTWETRIARSLPFWKYYFPKLQKQFPSQLENTTLEQFYQALNIAKPTFIRVDSDEVSYNLHILLRFEIEKQLIEKKCKVSEIPELWNAKMQEIFVITPKDHKEGCMQDIHWSMGAIGYFPTYTLGNLYAAQFFDIFAKEHTNWEERIAKGELTFLSEWQRENIHKYGRQFPSEVLCERISGKPLSETPFLSYLETKYKHLYKL